MKRFDLVSDGDGVAPVERPDGEWVQASELFRFVEAAARIASERDRYRRALVTIAGVPLTLPNAAAGVREAQRVISS